jgi:hypothetical protein
MVIPSGTPIGQSLTRKNPKSTELSVLSPELRF